MSSFLPETGRSSLSSCVDRALAQEGVDVRVVVADDASTDDTVDVLESRGDPRIKVLRHPERTGPSGARARALAAAETPWVAICDDDDQWVRHKLRRQLDCAAESGAEWSVAAAVVVDSRLRPIGLQAAPPNGDVAARMLRDNQMPGGGSSLLARREALVEAGGFDTRLGHLSDWDAAIRLSLRGPVAAVHEPLLAYMTHDRGLSNIVYDLGSELRLVERKYVAERLARDVTFPWDYWKRYESEIRVKNGDRRGSLRLHWEIFRDHRHYSWLPWAVAVAAAPRLLDLRARWYLARAAAPIRRAAAAVIDELRSEAG